MIKDFVALFSGGQNINILPFEFLMRSWHSSVSSSVTSLQTDCLLSGDGSWAEGGEGSVPLTKYSRLDWSIDGALSITILGGNGSI